MIEMIKKRRLGIHAIKLQVVTMRTSPMCVDRVAGSPMPLLPNDANAFLIPMTEMSTPTMGVIRNNAPEHPIARFQNLAFRWRSTRDGGLPSATGGG